MRDTVDQALDEAAIKNKVCPKCGGELDYPPMGNSSLNRDQFEAVATNKYCRKCDRCFNPECRECSSL